ncbi:MAG TPA: hypothetical protein VF544_05780 [Pyrinomonadaceae bacterium]|jgi:hypothetical protein
MEEETNVAWDSRFDDHGIDAVLWTRSDGENERRTMTIIFKETIENSSFTYNRLQVDVTLYPRTDAYKYSAQLIPDELVTRGIEGIEIVPVTDPFHHSVGYIKMKGVPEPLKVIKNY